MRRSAAVLVAMVLVAGLSALPSAAATAPASAPNDHSPPPASRFQKVTLNDRPGEPMSLAVLPDRRVLHTARTGQVCSSDPDGDPIAYAWDFDMDGRWTAPSPTRPSPTRRTVLRRPLQVTDDAPVAWSSTVGGASRGRRPLPCHR